MTLCAWSINNIILRLHYKNDSIIKIYQIIGFKLQNQVNKYVTNIESLHLVLKLKKVKKQKSIPKSPWFSYKKNNEWEERDT